MKILVCGGREFNDHKMVAWALAPYLPKRRQDLLIIQGGATGADRQAKLWAFENKVPVMEFPANWRFHGKSAGPLRNAEMLRWGEPDEVLAFPGGKGTADMVAKARAKGVHVTEIAPWQPCTHDDSSWCNDACVPPWKRTTKGVKAMS